MSEPVFFTLEGDFRGFVQDVAGDGNYTPENVPISATVTITPMLDGIVRATTASPRPVAHLAAPTVAIIDPADGRLKIRSAGESGSPGGFTFTPVKLLANTAYLELDPATPLFYRVVFTNVTFGGNRGSIAGFDFEAPNADVTVNLVELAPQTGAVANGLTKIAPTAVRQNEDGLTVFSFSGVDISSPLDLRGPTGATGSVGATGPTGAAATISIASVTTGAPGSTATAVNVGTSGAAELALSIPRGDTGATGATGAAATIAVGTVSTGAVGSTAAVTNIGTSGAAVFDITIPRGDTGSTGSTGATGAVGATGDAATITVGTVSTGAVGSTATVTNTGTSGAAVFDISIPRGDTGAVGATGAVGSEGPRGATGIQGIPGPAGVSLDINGTLANYAAITALSSPAAGDAYVNAADGKLYFFDGTSWPADGDGVPFVGPIGPEGPAGSQGIAGPTGAVGATGERGERGERGETGSAATISVGTVTTGDPGSTASFVNSGTSGAAVFDITIPRGDTGAVGSTGAQGSVGATGATGAAGAAATITVGTVTTGAAGSTASVVNSGTSSAAVFDITIPRGDTGVAGATGTAATISVGDVSTGAAGSTATVTNVGSSGAAVFNFSIPTGATGAVGATGPAGPTGAAATVAIGTVTTGGAGSAASVTNVGTSTAAVFDITIPKGDTGSADPSTWETLDGRPTVVAAGATKADARSAIDAAYSGDIAQANGIASLDSAGKVPYSQLPASIMSYQGTWNASTNTPTLADGTGDQGDVYRVTVAASRDLGSGTISWGVGDYAIYNGTVWEKSDSTDAVASVNGYTGVVSLTKSDVGLSAVDNTADADKPISSAVSTALGGKEPTITAGSTGQYWRGDKTFATLDKNAVGLGNVDNTTDLGKPISTATQTALDGKEPTITAGSAGQYWNGSKTWATLDKSAVGLGNVDNTSDANKPVSTATSTALSAKEDTANKGATGGYCGLDAGSKVSIGNLPTGTTSSTVCIGDDSRLSDARTPTSHTHAVADINASTTTALGVGSLEVGHASDTTLSRSAAGVLAVEGVDVVTTSASQTLTSKTLTNPTVNNYTEGVVAVGTVSSSHTLSLTNGTVQTATLTASTACTFTMPTATAGKSFVLMLKQAASTGGGTATFTGVKWGTAGAPTITATAGKMDILSFFSDGTNWYGSISQGYTP